MPPLMLIGVSLFFAGTLGFLAQLFASGGWQRSRQFAVIGELASGRHGAARRWLMVGSLSLGALGAMLCFAGVAQMDAERAARCRDVCQLRGYAEGVIGPSVDRDPKRRFVACTCTGAGLADLELRADDLPAPSGAD